MFLGTRRVTEQVSGTGRRQLASGVLLVQGECRKMRRNSSELPDMGKKMALRKWNDIFLLLINKDVLSGLQANCHSLATDCVAP